MGKPRFSIASLLGVVLFVAIGFAGLRAASDAWDSGVLGTTLLALLVAVLLAIHRTGERRAFWVGFALFGWAYLIASLVTPIESRLPTTRGLAYLDSKVPGRQATIALGSLFAVGSVPSQPNTVRTVTFAPDGTLIAPGGPGSIRIWNMTGTSENFIQIGHSLLALVLAFVGGHLSRHLSVGSAIHRSDRSD